MDYYRTLDIEKGASRAEIRAAYLRLTAANHPDLNPDTDTSQRIREIHEAYEVLSDLKSRSAYDLNPDTFRESDVIYDGPRQEPQDFEPHPFQSHPASHRESFRKSPWADSHGTTQYNQPAGAGSPIIGLVGVCLAVVSLILCCVVYQRFQADMAIEQSAIDAENEYLSPDFKTAQPRWNNSYPDQKVKPKKKDESLALIDRMKQASKDIIRGSTYPERKERPATQPTSKETKGTTDNRPIESLTAAELERRLNQPLPSAGDDFVELNPDASFDFSKSNWLGGDVVPIDNPMYVPTIPPAPATVPAGSSYSSNFGTMDSYSQPPPPYPVTSQFTKSLTPQPNPTTSGLSYLNPSSATGIGGMSSQPNSQPVANPIGQRSHARETVRAMAGRMYDRQTGATSGAVGPTRPSAPVAPNAGFGGNFRGTAGTAYGGTGPLSSNGTVLSTSLDQVGGGFQMTPTAPVTGGFGMGTTGATYTAPNRVGPATSLPGGASNPRLPSLPSYNGPGLNGSF